MRKTEKLELPSGRYTLTQLGGSDGLRLLPAAMSFMGSLHALMSVDEAPNPVLEAKGLVASFNLLREADTAALRDAFVKATTVEVPMEGGGFTPPIALADVFEDHFAGRMQGLFALLSAHVALNYSDFLGASGIARASSTAMAPAHSASPRKSGGISGDRSTRGSRRSGR